MKEHRQLRKFWSFLLAFAMVFTTAVGNIGPVVMAADDDTFVEVTVPNGDFESQTTGWTFNGTEGTNGDTKYWRVFKNEWAQNNKTNWYEAYSHTEMKTVFLLHRQSKDWFLVLTKLQLRLQVEMTKEV